ncbi:putative agmatinase [Arthrobacter globiformis NBRC 12137]|uniref:Putative agmatinase n=1 Tax=Arthrobacter globiformis (strain ATCC 8010 / DSM 20124 / JCM 1332 / NBRC 12137 / NCIMB 8907 / NRRL B-2979 / 168) TaxID=1077972 RepID=H0QK35_ARTG1|nr:agmatinase [Arthrobacter globiformis]GAB13275.1 putative agmatinase [Arthrobacter globiformis NBRC 12137]
MSESPLVVPRITTGTVTGQPDFTRLPRYAAPATFAALPAPDEVSDLDVAIVGVPYDSGVSYRPGTRFGPAHIRNASKLLRPFNPEADAWPFQSQQIADLGDVGVNPYNIDEAITSIEWAMRGVLERSRRLLVLGGDHSIALPTLRALHAVHGPIAVVHFDAHLDTWDTYFNTPILHGTPFRRASEEGLLDQEACMHIGTRGGLYAPGDMDDDRALGFATVRCEEIELTGLTGAIEKLKARVGDRPVYVSVDIDVLDPAFAPGTGTPESGGLTSRELLTMLRSMKSLNIVGGDIVEVSPAYDHADITGIAAAHVGYEILSAIAPAVDLSSFRTR